MRLLFLLVLLVFFSSCGNDEVTVPPDSEPQISPPSGLDVRDVANKGDVTDFEFSFTKPTDAELVSEYRIFIIKTAAIAQFDSLAAMQATPFVSIPFNGNNAGVSFPEAFTDIDGDEIQEGVSYSFFVLAFGSETDGGALSQASAEITLQQKSAVRTITSTINGGSGGMDADADGNIYMGDFGLNLSGAPGSNVFKITPEGTVSVFASGMIGASGNDFDNEGNLYQSSIQGGTVSKITPDGNVSTFATGFTGPVGIAFDGSDSFYVCNCSNNTISKVDMDGNVSLFSSSTLLNCPNGIDIDDDGNIYIANFSSSVIVKITPEGVASSFATMGGNNMGHLIIRNNVIYVVARGLNSIYTVNMQGVVTLFAGTGARGLRNGGLTEATFSLPNDIAFSPDGTKIYINDVANFDPPANGVIGPVVIREIDIVK